MFQLYGGGQFYWSIIRYLLCSLSYLYWLLVKKLSLLLTAKPNTYYVDSRPDTQNSICFPVVNPDLSHNKISSQDVCGKFTINIYFITQ